MATAHRRPAARPAPDRRLAFKPLPHLGETEETRVREKPRTVWTLERLMVFPVASWAGAKRSMVFFFFLVGWSDQDVQVNNWAGL